MHEVDSTSGPVHETRKVLNDARERVSQTRKLLRATHRVFEKNLAIHRETQATIQRLQERLAQSRPAIRLSVIPRGLHLIISAKIDEGRLPDTASRVALVSGFGGECEACGDYMPSTQLVKAIPKKETFVYLHAECYTIWLAQCRVRQIFRPFESPSPPA